MHHKHIHLKGGKLIHMKGRLVGKGLLLRNFVENHRVGLQVHEGTGLLISANVLNAPVNYMKKKVRDTVTQRKYPITAGGSLLNNIKLPINNAVRKVNSNIRF